MPDADGGWRIVEDDLSGTPIRALLEAHFAGMLANSPAESCHFLDFAGLRADGVTFWSIHKGDDLAGCGALKVLDAQHGEIKSMRTAAPFCGRVSLRGCSPISWTKRAAAAFNASVSKPGRARRSNPPSSSTAITAFGIARHLPTTSPIRSAVS